LEEKLYIHHIYGILLEKLYHNKLLQQRADGAFVNKKGESAMSNKPKKCVVRNSAFITMVVMILALFALARLLGPDFAGWMIGGAIVTMVVALVWIISGSKCQIDAAQTAPVEE
jgi:hypothetical protein